MNAITGIQVLVWFRDLILGSEKVSGHGETHRIRKCKETEGDSLSVSLGSRFGDRLYHAAFERMLTIELKESAFLDQRENPCGF